MKILGIEIETDFDYNDADDAEKFEKVMKETGIKLQNMSEKGKTRSQMIREACGYIFDCIDNIFGKDVHKKLFGEKCNINKCIEAYKDLMKEMTKQADLPLDKAIEFAKEYIPNSNAERLKNEYITR